QPVQRGPRLAAHVHVSDSYHRDRDRRTARRPGGVGTAGRNALERRVTKPTCRTWPVKQSLEWNEELRPLNNTHHRAGPPRIASDSAAAEWMRGSEVSETIMIASS